MTAEKKVRLRPFLVNISLLLLAIVFNVAVGAVFIPPDSFVKILLNNFFDMNLVGDWPDH